MRGSIDKPIIEMANPRVERCHDCDVLQEIPTIGHGERAICSRCDAVLFSHKTLLTGSAIALLLGGLVLFFIANLFPIIRLNLSGITQESRIVTGIVVLTQHHMQPLALIVFITAIAAPMCRIFGLLYVLVSLQYGFSAPHLGSVFRWVKTLSAWSMMDIYLLGVLVALTKLGSVAQLILGPAFYAFAALVVLLAFIFVALDEHDVWDRLQYPARAT